MVTSTMVWPLVVAAALCVSMCALPEVHARSSQDQHMKGPLRGGSAHSLEKRQVYDRSCKGVYDLDLFADLTYVCDECYNLYRHSGLSKACRMDCFGQEVFEFCLDKLLLPGAEQENYLKARDALIGQEKAPETA